MAVDNVINNDEHILENLKDILRRHEEGKFAVNGMAGVTFQFNTRSGTIIPVSTESRNVTTFINPALFGHITTPASDIMALLARRDFLLGLQKLGDSDINRIISKYRIDMAETSNEMDSAVNKALKDIISLVTPKPMLLGLFYEKRSQEGRNEVHRAIFEVISQHRETLRSREEAASLISQINGKLGPGLRLK